MKVPSLLTITLPLSLIAATASADNILFIRGGIGTVGFFEGGADEQGADICNYATNGGNHGWGELAAALHAEEFTPTQTSEDPVSSDVPTPIPLDTLDLSAYSIIVFGSNNAAYTTGQVDALMAYVQSGGAALFISDANFGQDWRDAPDSDQHFLDRFGLTMNQDTGTYTVRRASEFLVPTHPIFNGVNTFDREGVSPITLSNSSVPGVSSTILSAARNTVRRNENWNTGNNNQGQTVQSAGANDGTLVVATYGSGRIAAHFDRNTFFNLNGAGTNINRFENEAYARNLFRWLAQKPDFNPATDNYAPRAHFPDIPENTQLVTGENLAVDVIAKDPDGTVSSVELLVDGTSVSIDTTAPYQWNLGTLTAGTRTLTARVTDNDSATTDVDLPVEVKGALARTLWLPTASPNNADAGLAIDGVPGTRWASEQFQTSGQTFSLDFTQEEFFESIVLNTAANPEDYPRGYIVRGSHNGVDYETLATEPTTPAGAVTTINLSRPRSFRYLQIEQTGSSANRWWSIHEINLFSPSQDAVLPAASYRELHFGADASDPAKESSHWGDTVDFDNDGLNTLLEFAFNTDPTTPNSDPPLTTSFGTNSVDLTFPRWKDGNAISYEAQASGDLQDWTANNYTLNQIGAPADNGNGTETITWRLLFNSGDSNFVRLRVSE